MKVAGRLLIAVFALVLLISFNGCKKKRYGIVSSAIIEVKAHSVMLSAFALRKGFEKIKDRGFCYATHPFPQLSDSIVFMSRSENEDGKAGEIRATIKNLSLYTTYYVRAFSILEKGKVFYGEKLRFITNDKFEVGDIGPAGGLIFYDSNGFMEFVYTNLPAAEWGCKGTLLKTPVSHSLKYAKQNTEGIANECNTLNNAANACLGFEIKGFSEWYLPTRMDLGEIWKVHQKYPASGFNPATTVYWSSTQLDKDLAFSIDFKDGKELTTSKSELNQIIAVRKF